MEKVEEQLKIQRAAAAQARLTKNAAAKSAEAAAEPTSAGTVVLTVCILQLSCF